MLNVQTVLLSFISLAAPYNENPIILVANMIRIKVLFRLHSDVPQKNPLFFTQQLVRHYLASALCNP